MAAERFDTLDQVREQLARTQRTAAALSRFLDTYRGYARTRAAASAVRRCSTPMPRTAGVAREPKRLADEAEAAVRAQAAADAEVAQLFEDESRARVELEGLQASDAYKEHLNLVDRRRAVEAKRETARIASGKSAEAALPGGPSRQPMPWSGREPAAAAEPRVSDGRAVLVRLARRQDIDQAVVPRQAAAIAPAVAVRRRPTAGGRAGAGAGRARRRGRGPGRAGGRARRPFGAGPRPARPRPTRPTTWVAESRAWRRRSPTGPRGAARCHQRCRPRFPIWDALHRRHWARAPPAPRSWRPCRAVALAAAPAQEAARAAESGARADGPAEAERALVEQGGGAGASSKPKRRRARRPPASANAARDERAGAPLYELVEVVPDGSAADRAGLEAALEASGLLDAWVAEDGLVRAPVDPRCHPAVRRPAYSPKASRPSPTSWCRARPRSPGCCGRGSGGPGRQPVGRGRRPVVDRSAPRRVEQGRRPSTSAQALGARPVTGDWPS